MGNFKELKIWQEGIELATRIYAITDEGKFAKDFRFRDQIRAAAVSVPSNIAEGDELSSIKQSIRHLYIAKGSLAEVITQLVIAERIGHIDKKLFSELEKTTTRLSVKIKNLITFRSKALNQKQ